MGFIKLDRDIQNWQWYKDGNTFRLFVHCIIKANWCDNKFKGEVISRGSFVTSLDSLSSELGITIQQTKTAIKHLVDCEYITSKSTNKYRIITVLNYDERQGINKQLADNQQVGNKQDNKQITSDQQTNNKQVTTIEEIKEVLEDKESFISNINTDDLPFGIDQKNDAEVEQILDELEKEENWMKNVNLAESWEDGFQRPPSSSIVMRLMDDENLYGLEMTYLAIREAVLQGKCSIDYVDGILMNWRREGKTVDDLLNG